MANPVFELSHDCNQAEPVVPFGMVVLANPGTHVVLYVVSGIKNAEFESNASLYDVVSGRFQTK